MNCREMISVFIRKVVCFKTKTHTSKDKNSGLLDKELLKTGARDFCKQRQGTVETVTGDFQRQREETFEDNGTS